MGILISILVESEGAGPCPKEATVSASTKEGNAGGELEKKVQDVRAGKRKRLGWMRWCKRWRAEGEGDGRRPPGRNPEIPLLDKRRWEDE